MGLRNLARLIREAALASSAAARLAASSSPGASSATAYLMQLYGSEAALASLRSTTSAAARRAALNAVSCGPAHPLLDEAPFVSTRAAAYNVASTSPTASPPPSATTFCFYALVVTYCVDPNSAAAATQGEGEVLSTVPIPTSAAGSSSELFRPTTTSLYGSFIPTAASSFTATRFTAGAFPMTPPCGLITPAHYSTSIRFHEDSTDDSGVDHTIDMMNKIEMNTEAERRFRKAFHKKFFPYWDASAACDYIRHQIYNEKDCLQLMKAVYKKAGPNAESMILQIREGLESNDYSSCESPAIRRLEVRVDVLSRRVEDANQKLDILLESKQNKKMEWFSFNLFGRKFDASKVVTFVMSIWV